MVGERVGDNIVAATVDAYTSLPDMQAGELSDISGLRITPANEGSDDPNHPDHRGEDLRAR